RGRGRIRGSCCGSLCCSWLVQPFVQDTVQVRNRKDSTAGESLPRQVAGESRRIRLASAAPFLRRLARRLQVVLGHLGESRSNGLSRSAAADQLGFEAEAPLGLALETMSDEIAGRADVVEVSLGGETVEG